MLVQLTIEVDDDASWRKIREELRRKVNSSTLRDYVEMGEKRIAVASVIEAVAQVTGVSVLEIKSKKRTANIAKARMMVYYVACKRCGIGYSNLGSMLGLDHSTVMYGTNKTEKQAQADAVLAAKLNDVYTLAKEIDDERFERLKDENKVVWIDPEERRKAMRPVLPAPSSRPYLSVPLVPRVRRDVKGNLIVPANG